jgi:hypothetical protein
VLSTKQPKVQRVAGLTSSSAASEQPKSAPNNPLASRGITDKEGMQRAYEQGDAYAYGDTLYVAGSHTAKDWYDDVTKVPFWGDVRNATRYQQAEKALAANPNIKNVVGHSLGGSVALELQKNHSGLASRTYGAPVWDPMGEDNKYKGFSGQVERYRNHLDPVSAFDGSAENHVKWDPWSSGSMTHDYGNIAENMQAGGDDHAYGWTNPDGTISLTQ